MNSSQKDSPVKLRQWVIAGASPMEIARDYGIIHSDGASFDELADRLRKAGMSLHPSIIATNWEPEPIEAKDFCVVALSCPVVASQRRARRDVGLRGLQQLSPRETLAFLLAHADQSLDDYMHFVSLGYVWHDVQKLPAVIGCFRFLGQPRIGPVPADEDGSYPEKYHFLAKF